MAWGKSEQTEYVRNMVEDVRAKRLANPNYQLNPAERAVFQRVLNAARQDGVKAPLAVKRAAKRLGLKA